MTTQSAHLEAIRTVGVMAGQSKRLINRVWGAVSQTKFRLGGSSLSREEICKIIAEHSAQMNPEQQELALQAYDRRLKAMSEALHALQEKIAELQASGHLNASTMAQAIGEVQSDEHFSADERNILATILKQNIVLQKPELVKDKIPSDVV